MDSQGLVRITHMGIAGQGAMPTPPRGGTAAPITQRTAKSWVQFMILPDDASVDEDE